MDRRYLSALMDVLVGSPLRSSIPGQDSELTVASVSTKMDGQRRITTAEIVSSTDSSEQERSRIMDYYHLGLGSASSLVRSVRLTDWGDTVLIECLYDPLGERKSYQLLFQGCSQVRIDLMPDAPVHEPEADLIGISLGTEGGREPAILTTDLFELHVTYRQFQCIKPGQSAEVSART